MPAAAHGLPVPTRSGVLLHRGDVAFLFMVNGELEEIPEVVRVGEQEKDPVGYTHDWERGRWQL